MSRPVSDRCNRPPPLSVFPVLVLACVLSSCATRPGPEVLNPVPASARGVKVVTVYVATTRTRENPASNIFTNGRSQNLNYAEFKISIPPGHRAGAIEWPTGTPDPTVNFTTLQQNVLDARAFEQRITLRGNGRNKLRTGVFVHGFNTNFQEALYRVAQLTADAGLDDAPILFAWPSQAEVTGYVADRDAVTYSRDQLSSLLAKLARNPAVGDITIVGHSMGSWLTVEALRQLRLTGNNALISRLKVILAAPDIDVDVFRAQMDVIGPLNPPMTLLVSRDDVALSFSSRIAGERQRIGTLNVDDPTIQEAAAKAKVQIIDISELKASDGLNHDRFVSLAALYPRLAATEADATGRDLRSTGAYILDAVGATLASPFILSGQALAGK